MAIIRVLKDKNNPYVILNKTCLQDDELSWKAKGLHSYLLSLPDDWQIYIEDLKNRSKDGRDATSNILRELIKAGYVKRTPRRDKDTNKLLGGYDYEVYEVALENPDKLKSRKPENPVTGKPENRELRKSENPTLLNNNNKLSNKLELNNELNKIIIGYYQKYIGIITPNQAIEIFSFLDDGMESDVIIRAIDEAVGNGVRNYNYVKSILNNWLILDIKNSAQLTEHIKNKKINKSSNNSIQENKGNYNKSGGKNDGKYSEYQRYLDEKARANEEPVDAEELRRTIEELED